MTERRSYREGVAYSALNMGLLAVLAIFSSIAIARLYGARVVGEYALVMAPVTVTWTLSTTREQVAFVREISVLPARAPLITGLFAAIFTFSFGLTLVVGALTVAGTYFLFNGPIGHPWLFAPAAVNMLGYLLITNTGWNLDAILGAFRAGRALFWIRLAQAVSYVVIAVVGALWTPTVWMLVAATIGSYFVCLLLRIGFVRPFVDMFVSGDVLREGFSFLPEMIRFGLKMTPGGIGEGLSNQAGIWILGAFGSLPAVGAYNRAWQLGYRLVEMKDRISEMLFPTLVERRFQGDRVGFDRALVDSLRYAAVGLLLPAAAGAGAASGVMALFGPGFSSGATAFPLLLLMPAFACMTNLQRAALFAVDRPLMGSAGAVTRAAATIGLSFPLILWLGVPGAAVAVIVGYGLDLAMMVAATIRHLVEPFRAYWPLREMGALGAAYVAGAGAARAVDVGLSGPFGTVAALAGGSVAYATIFALLGGINRRDRERVRSVIATLELRGAVPSRIATWPRRLRSTT